MKQCYFSEKLNKYFDDKEACVEAESKYDKEQAEEKAKKAEISKRKRELADAVEKADKELADAYDHLEVCKADADKIIKEAKEEAAEIIKQAKEELCEKQKMRLEAIAEFNKEFGAYTTTYSGDKALEEIKRFNVLMDSSGWVRNMFELLSNI